MNKIKVHTSLIGTTGYNNHVRDFLKPLNKLINLKVRNYTVGGSWNGYNNDEPHNGEDYLDNEFKTMLVEQSLWKPDGTEKFDEFPLYQEYINEGETPLHIVFNDTNHHYFYENFDGKKIAYNVWETTRFPDEFFNTLLRYDQLWVPSKWQKEMAIEQGYPSEKIKVVPEAVNGDLYHPKNIKWEDSKFRFLIFGRWEYRKSTMEMVKSFLEEFGNDENVELVISADNPYPVDGMNSTEERLDFYGFNHKNVKIIHFPSKEEYIEYLQKGHVFLSCARAEGWNLPLIEAMACGTPSLYSNWSGQLEFAEGKGIPVDYVSLVPASVGEGKIYTQSPIAGDYCEPNFEDFKKKMRMVYENYEFYKEKSMKESKDIRNTFRWDKMAEIAKDFIVELMPETFNVKEKIGDKYFDNDYAFVTCGNIGYMPIIEKMVQSLLKFSSRKVLVYGINCDVPFDYPNLIKKRIDIEEYSQYDKWYWKQYTNIESCNENFEKFVWIDGDVIVNYNIDNVSTYFNQLENYPISDIHVQNEFFGTYERNGVKKTQLFTQVWLEEKHPEVIKTRPIAHVCFYIYDKNSKWFFEEIIKTYKSIDLNDYKAYFLWNDEGIHNFLLWKYNFKKHLPLSNFDTSGYISEKNIFVDSIEDFYKFWNTNGPNNFGEIYGWKFIPKNKENILYFHGNKNKELCNKMIEFIELKQNNSFRTSEYFHIEKNNVKNLGSIKGVHGSTLDIAYTYGWDYAIYHEIYNLLDYEPINIPEVRVNDGDVVVDLGGNIGVFNRFAHSKGASKVISFEPDKRYFELLKLNAGPNSILFRAAMANNLGTTKFTESDHLGGSNIMIDYHETANQYDVETYTLNHLFESGLIEKIDFLKIDIEGAEKYTFEGVSDENLLKISKISMEYHHAALNKDDDYRHNLITRLNKLGFNSYLLYLGMDNELQMIYFWRN